MVVAIYLRGIGKIWRRSLLIATLGWLLSGIAASFLNWPARQKLELMILLGGAAILLQACWRLIIDPRAIPPASGSPSSGVAH